MLSTLRDIPENTVYEQVKSPVGELTLIATEKKLLALLWDIDLKKKSTQKKVFALKKARGNSVIQETKRQLKEYFARKRRKFDIPLGMQGTEFQKKSWKQLQRIPYGKTRSYGEQAQAVGNKNKARAVGSANGKNPISIIVPCHRVIAGDGSLGGFGGGLDRKRFLLKLESRE